jgi:SAM-dependent methyltransferase
MPFKKILEFFVRETSRLLMSVPLFRSMFIRGWERTHPFDLANGTDTSGFLPPDRYHSVATSRPYAGSQPGIVRAALAKLPSPETFTFIDLGCGKGRPLLVATEFPFRDIVGVELSPALTEIARSNALILRKRYPNRTPVRIETADASTYNFPSGNLAIFLYDPFGQDIISKIATRLETALAAEKRTIYVIYYNPIHGACFDASPALTRYFAALIPYAEEDRGFGPDADDVVVIWQGGGEAQPFSGADTPFEIICFGLRAQLASAGRGHPENG